MDACRPKSLRRYYEEHARHLLGRGGELEDDVLAGEGLVDGREAVELVLEGVLVLGVKEDLAKLATVLGNTDALASDLRGEDEVLEGLLVDDGEGTRTGALLANLGSGLARLLGEDAALGNEDDKLVGKLLLELTGEAGDDGNSKKLGITTA